MSSRKRRLRHAARSEGQRMRIIRLLESLADEDPKEQCPDCGQWFESVASHQPHCDGPTG